MNYLILNIFFILFIPSLSHVITSNNKNINLCINCKHFIPSEFNNKFARCNKYSITNEITGDKILPYACIIRKSELLCGKTGKSYESKYNSDYSQS